MDRSLRNAIIGSVIMCVLTFTITFSLLSLLQSKANACPVFDCCTGSNCTGQAGLWREDEQGHIYCQAYPPDGNCGNVTVNGQQVCEDCQ